MKKNTTSLESKDSDIFDIFGIQNPKEKSNNSQSRSRAPSKDVEALSSLPENGGKLG